MVSIFQTLKMPKHFRQCHYCPNNSFKNDNIVIFSASENLKTLLNVLAETVMYICEEHFNPHDVKPHGDSKRLLDSAVPMFLPRQAAVTMDHNYVLTTPLDMVRFYLPIGLSLERVRKKYLYNRWNIPCCDSSSILDNVSPSVGLSIKSFKVKLTF